MDLLSTTKELCRLYNISPERSKGQNFLITENVYEQIITAGNLATNDLVLEIGPGLGFLTAKLARAVKQVLAVELDDKLAAILKTELLAKKINNVALLNQDILRFNFSQLESVVKAKQPAYKIIANLPYNITSIFLKNFLTAHWSDGSDARPQSMVLMLQKEVAERITAKPGNMSVLAVSVQFYAQSEIMQIVPASDFWPAPRVDSAIIRIVSQPILLDSNHEKQFFRLVKSGFSARRKMLKNNLANGLNISPLEVEKGIVAVGLKPQIRAQELSVNDWLKLFAQFQQFML